MTQQVFALEIGHRIHYSNRELIPIQEIASSLLALERILLRAPKVFSLTTSVPIDRAEVYVKDIASGSLTEDVIIKVFFRSKEELDAFLLKINEKIGQNTVTRNVLLSALILSVVGYGLYGAASYLGAKEAAKTINVNNNVIINLAAEHANFTPQQLHDIVATAISDKKANAKDAIEFVRPAKRDPEASITLEGSALLTLPKEVVYQTPAKLNFEASPTERFIPDIDLQIRATNLDSTVSGWAGIIPQLMDRRVKLVLAEGIDPKSVARKFSVRADVILHAKPQGEKRVHKVYQITLVRLIQDE